MDKILNNINLVPRINKLTETQKAYIAGLWDGEGYIGITRRGNRNAIRAAMSVSISNKKYMENISNILGINFREEKSFRKVQKQRVYRINLGSQTDMLYLAKQIEPYLIMKKLQAQLLIGYLEYRLNKLLSAKNMKTVKFEAREFEIMQSMFLLNSRNYKSI